MPISTGPDTDGAAGRTEPVRRWGRRKVLLGGAGAVALAGGLAGVLLAPSGPAMAIGQPLPDFDLGAIEGIAQSGFDQRATRTGATLVLNAFASWCVPCRAEHPMLMRLAREHGITVQGMNVQDLPEQAMEFLAELGNPYARIGADPNRAVANRLGLVGLPHSFILDGEGALRVSHPGPIDEHFLATVLNI
jgi:cytochrome c biogenesis protein CcmG/thiol:disulfide interchange protein DsbE